ncbi:MAG TPA: SDR family oxidoreductase [Gemmatimonadales bacterium]|nr:SDR family oxidoreductase [Gemmatimonadales bacterium]
MAARSQVVFVTGASGLLGGDALRRMLAADPALRAVVLVRAAGRWERAAAELGIATDRVAAVVGDVTRPGLGLDADARRRLARDVTVVVHAAADVVFSRSIAVARAVNAEGTRHMLDLAAAWPHARRFVYVSTAFVAGRRVGRILEGEDGGAGGWVNAYEQSKSEAECLVRASDRDWLILRPSTIVCDSVAGTVTQYNAVHLGLRLLYDSLAPMLPAAATTGVDVVPRDYVAAAIAALATRAGLAGRTLHLCAGAGALPVGELLDLTWEAWSRVPEWRRRAVPRPVLADHATYRRFEEAVEETGDRRLRAAVRALSHFVPQLALPKEFETAGADALLGGRAPAVQNYWPRLIQHLVSARWAVAVQGVAA